MTCSQQINLINEKSYDDDITVTDVPKGYFLAVTNNVPPAAGSTTREIRVELLPLEQAPSGTSITNSGLYTRQDGETEVKVTVTQDGTVKCDNTTAY